MGGAVTAVHPRVGGEHQQAPVLDQGDNGSSPRGRGTLHGAGLASITRRFIPAWAGNTLFGITMMSVMAVHPRVGGEHGAR